MSKTRPQSTDPASTEAAAGAGARASGPLANRIGSMDQFRGYTVAGMFLVNFLGGYAAIHPVLKHNESFLSYADTIMPSFMFACGFSYRLSTLRRIETKGKGAAYWHAIVRSLGLVLISLMVFGFGTSIKTFASIPTDKIGDFVIKFVAKILKADLWETLAIIGVAQLLILPVVARGVFARLFTILLFLGAHGAITYYFNYDFMFGKPNAIDEFLGITGTRTWDGGFFGVMMWAVPMLIGTLAYDGVRDTSPGRGSFKLVFWGSLLMILGYGLSGLTRLYDVTPEARQKLVAALDAKVKDAADKAAAAKKAAESAAGDAKKKADDDAKAAADELAKADAAARNFKVPENADSPVLFDVALLQSKVNAGDWKSLLAEVPFFPPPGTDARQYNYWMIRKRIVSPAFTLFSSGFALALLGLFVVFTDGAGIRIPIFRTLGTNALAAYVIHEKVSETIHSVVPRDSPLWYVMAGLAVFYVISYGLVRWLEGQKVFIRL